MSNKVSNLLWDPETEFLDRLPMQAFVSIWGTTKQHQQRALKQTSLEFKDSVQQRVGSVNSAWINTTIIS